MSYPGAFRPGEVASPSTKVEVAVTCKGLADRDYVSKSDPVCVLYEQVSAKQWSELGRTEQIKNTLSPAWQKKFILDYRFEEKQNLKFAVYDWDGKSTALNTHDFLGELDCSLGEIVALQSKGFTKKLQKKPGSISILAEEVSGSNDDVSLCFRASNLDNKDMFGKSDPFMVISRINEGRDYTVVHRTETIQNNLNPVWKEINLKVATLCNGNYDRSLRFEVFDEDDNGSHDLIGTFHTTLAQLVSGDNSGYDVINEKKRAKKGKKYVNSGRVTVQKARLEQNPTFLDFIHGGLQVNFTVAIDFTGSNGHPSDPRSLHYKSPTGEANAYVTGIQAVGEIVQDYDYDKMFPSLGFGAMIPPRGEVSHEFFLTLDPNNPFCSGVHGILEAYYRTLHNVQLSGPTNFSPVINHVARFADAYKGEPSNYFVLLIITDGIITDMQATKDAIVRASFLPMSLIIVGVGDADFSAMEELDADRKALKSSGKVAARDIVQFVELNQFRSSVGFNREALAKAVLGEVPGQVLMWMKKNGFNPTPRI